MTSTVTDYNLALRDGRTVSLAEFGDPSGRPVIHLHGASSCRLEAQPFDESAREHGVRVLSIDRPGVGRSSGPLLRSATGYATDVAMVADALNIDDFVISGFSNGGMYAAAAAHVLGDRITRVVPINPTTPVADPGVTAVLPLASKLAYGALRRFPKFAARHRVGVPHGLSARIDPDRVLLQTAPLRDLLARIGAEPHREGYLLAECTLAVQPWGFDHRALTQPVDFFSGEQDAGRRYAEIWVPQLPQATLHLLPGGHSSFMAPKAAAAITRCVAA